MLSFVSLDVLGEYARSLFGYSICTQHKFFPRILRIRQNSLGIYEKGFDEIGEKEGPFPCSLHVRHLCAFSIYAKILYVHLFAEILYAHSPYTSKFVMHIRRQIL
jgi:hypothetical protein